MFPPWRPKSMLVHRSGDGVISARSCVPPWLPMDFEVEPSLVSDPPRLIVTVLASPVCFLMPMLYGIVSVEIAGRLKTTFPALVSTTNR